MGIPVDHVLFDCDGTLFDTEGLKARSWGVALASALDLATLFASHYRAGATAREVADDLLRRCRPDLLQQRLALEARERFPTGLVSASQPEWVRRYFAASRPLDNGGQPVTDPAAFFRPLVCGLRKGAGIQRAVREALGVSEYSQVPPEQRASFVIFEDSLEGLRESRAAGIRTVAVPDALAADPAIAELADLVLPTDRVAQWRLADILRWLDGQTPRAAGGA